MKLSEIPVPPAAKKTEISGFEREQFNNALAASLSMIRERYKSVESDAYQLSAKTSWQELAAFYDEKLKAKGFTRATQAPVESLDSQILFWEKSGLTGKQAAAVVLIKTGSEASKDDKYFLLIGAASN